jgi:hypothetical protein
MNLNTRPLLQLLSLLIGLWCAFPLAAQELTEFDDSCEDIIVLEDCSNAEKCCAQAAPIRAILLTIARCSADPEPIEEFCEMLPHAPLPKSVLSYILRFEAAKKLPTGEQTFFQAALGDEHPVPPSTSFSFGGDDRALSVWLPTLPAPSYSELILPAFTFEMRLLSGVGHLPETPG